jgi:hypothetical protein
MENQKINCEAELSNRILPFIRGIDIFDMNRYITGLLLDFLKYFYDFIRKHECNERQIGPFWRKICKHCTVCLGKKARSGSRTIISD